MSAPPSMPPQSRFGFDDSELPHPANHRRKSRAAGPHCAAAAEGSFAAVLLTPAQAQVLGDQQRARSGAAKMTQTSKAKHPALPSIPDINRGSTPRDCQSQSPLRAIFRPQLHLFDPYFAEYPDANVYCCMSEHRTHEDQHAGFPCHQNCPWICGIAAPLQVQFTLDDLLLETRDSYRNANSHSQYP